MRILISGASISGPVLAYWLTRYGFDVTVVERAPRCARPAATPSTCSGRLWKSRRRWACCRRSRRMPPARRAAMYRRVRAARARRSHQSRRRCIGPARRDHARRSQRGLLRRRPRRRRVPVRRLDHGDLPRRRRDFRARGATHVRHRRRRRRAALERSPAWSSAKTPDTPGFSAATWPCIRCRKRLRAKENGRPPRRRPARRDLHRATT